MYCYKNSNKKRMYKLEFDDIILPTILFLSYEKNQKKC